MRVEVGEATFQPDVEAMVKRRIVAQALQQVARRVGAVRPDLTDLRLGDLTLDMPVPLEAVQSGQYTESAAADFLANRIFRALVPHLGAAARERDVLVRAQVHGAEGGFAHVNGPRITVQHLESLNLAPTWRVEIEGVRYHLSDPFIMNSRTAYVCFVEHGGTVHTRVFYSSQSQGVWRSASHRAEGMAVMGLGPEWIGKGHTVEESTDLPYELYHQLEARAGSPRQDIDHDTARGVFYGLLEVKTIEDFARNNEYPTEGFFPGEARTLGSFAQTIEHNDKEWGRPETFSFHDEGDAPDFTRVVDEFESHAPVHGGNVRSYVFASRNGRLAYVFNRDPAGRAWLATVQCISSAVTSRGARREVIDPGNLSLPLQEYKDQIHPQFRGKDANPVDSSYRDAWEYVKRLTIIGDLYRARGWEMPGGFPVPPLVPLRHKTFKVGDYVRVPRSGGRISWAQLVAVNGQVASVLVPAPGGQWGNKDVAVSSLMVCYRQNEPVNVPRSSGPPCAGTIVLAEADDQFMCSFVDPQSGQAKNKRCTGLQLDAVNVVGGASSGGGGDGDQGAPGGVVIQRKPLQASGGAPGGVVRRKAIQGVSYKPPQLSVSPAGGKRKKSLGDRLKGLIGLGGGKVEIQRPTLSAEEQAASDAFVADFRAVEAAMYKSYELEKGALARLKDGLAAHLARHGVAFDLSGNEFTIKPLQKGAPLNVLAWTAKRRLGITMSYDIRERLSPWFNHKEKRWLLPNVGSFNSEGKHLKLDSKTVLACKPSGTALHELHHAALYKKIAKKQDSFLNLKMWNLSRSEYMSSAGMYTDFMSNQELSTFAKQPRQVVATHLGGRGEAVYTARLHHELRTYLAKLSHVATQGKEVATKIIRELESYLATGQSSVMRFSSSNDGLEISFQSRDGVYHHRITVHTHADEHSGAGVNKPAQQKVLAQDMLQKMRVTLAVSELLLVQAHVIHRELGNLTPGQTLTEEEVAILKDLTGWAGYGMRVLASSQLDMSGKLAELARQRTLATSRLGGDSSTLGPLEFEAEPGDD